MKYFLGLLILLASVPAFAETAYERVTRTGEIRCGYGVYSPWISRNLDTNEIEGVIKDHGNSGETSRL